jgi:hypothetical protein
MKYIKLSIINLILFLLGLLIILFLYYLYTWKDPDIENFWAFDLQKRSESMAKARRAMTNYLTYKGLIKNKEEIAKLLQKDTIPQFQLEKWSENFERHVNTLVLKGLTVYKIKKLKENGIDIIKTIKMWEKPSIAEVSAASDLTIIGEIKDSVNTPPPSPDAYHSSITINVKEVLFGENPGNEIAIRQISGPLSRDRFLSSSNDLLPRKGDQFLFILSHKYYIEDIEIPYFQDTSMPQILPPKNIPHYYLRGRAYQIIDGKLQGDCGDPTRLTFDSLEKVISEIKRADKIVKHFKKTDKNWEK